MHRLTEWLDYKPLRHLANSAGIVRFKEASFDMCRLGLGLYGYGWEYNDNLIPVASLSTRIVQIKTLRKGESIGYGRAARLTKDTTIATIPIGYADGLDRHLGNGRWSVRVGGKMAPIIGRVCMDSAMVDITNIEGVEVGDKVTIFLCRARLDIGGYGTRTRHHTLRDYDLYLGTRKTNIHRAIMRGTIYMIPCPIADSESVWEVLPDTNRKIMNSLDYFIVENVRSARRFLSKAGIERKIDELEFVELNEHTTSQRDIERMLRPVLEGARQA